MTVGSRIERRRAVGWAQVGSLSEVVESDAPADMAWTSVTGIDQRGRWRLRDLGPDRTKVTLRLAYQAPGGLVGWLVDHIAAGGVPQNVPPPVGAPKGRARAERRAGPRH